MRPRSIVALLIAALSLLLSLLPVSVRAGVAGSKVRGPSPAAASIASVNWIQKGLTVQPPKQQAVKGKTNQKLYSRYGLRTKPQQRARLRFQDTTLLSINERTNLVLRNPHLTQVKSGTIDQVVAPGTDHRVQTASAVASAIGTEFLVRATRKTEKGSKQGKKPKKKVVVTTEVAVKEGVVDVRNQYGDVVVHAGQETVVVQGQAPAPPVAIDVKTLFAWTDVIPAPANPPGQNVALQDNGGRVIAASSESKAPAPAARGRVRPHGVSHQAVSGWAAAFINDGSTKTGWSSGQGQVKDQWVLLGFGQEQAYLIGSIIIDPAATRGHPASQDLKDFELWVSTSGTDASHFEKVYSGQTKQADVLQRFVLPKPVPARYLKLVAVDNYGSQDAVDVAEMEVVSTGKPVILPTATPTNTPVATATSTATPVPTPTRVVLKTYSFDVTAGIYDFDAGDTPGVPTTEELYKYQIKGSTCGPDMFSQPWNLTQHESSDDDHRNLDISSPFTMTFKPGADEPIPGGYYATTLQPQPGDASNPPAMVVDISAPQHNPPEIRGPATVTVTEGCQSPQATMRAQRATLQTNQISEFQAAILALRQTESHTNQPVVKLKARRAALLRRERRTVRLIHQGHKLGLQLRRLQHQISELDESIHEYGEMTTMLRGAQARAQRQLQTALKRSMYGTWLKASGY